MYALNPSGGNNGVKEEDKTEDGKGVIFANIVPKRSRRSFNTCAKEKAGQRLAAVEVPALAAALRGVGQTLQGSFSAVGGGRPDYLQKLKVPEGFSAVSKPNFASKYALDERWN